MKQIGPWSFSQRCISRRRMGWSRPHQQTFSRWNSFHPSTILILDHHRLRNNHRDAPLLNNDNHSYRAFSSSYIIHSDNTHNVILNASSSTDGTKIDGTENFLLLGQFSNSTQEEVSSFSLDLSHLMKKKKVKRVKLDDDDDTEIMESTTTFHDQWFQLNFPQQTQRQLRLLPRLKSLANIFSPIFKYLDKGLFHKALFKLEQHKSIIQGAVLDTQRLTAQQAQILTMELEKYKSLAVGQVCDTLLDRFDQTHEYLKIQKVLSFLRDFTNHVNCTHIGNFRSLCDPIIQRSISILIRSSIDSMKSLYSDHLFEAVKKDVMTDISPSLMMLLDIFQKDEFSQNSYIKQCISFILELNNNAYFIMDIYTLDIILELLMEGRKFDVAFKLVQKESDRLILPFLKLLSNDHSDQQSSVEFTYHNVPRIYGLVEKVMTIFGESGKYDQLLNLYKILKRPSQHCFNILVQYLAQSQVEQHYVALMEIILDTVKNRHKYVHIITPINIKNMFRSNSIITKHFTPEDIETLRTLIFENLNMKPSPRILNLFLNLYLKHGMEKEAFEIFEQFYTNGVDTNVSTLTIILTYLCEQKQYIDAIKISDKSITEPIVFDIPFLNMLWKIYYEYIWKHLLVINKTSNNGFSKQETNIQLLEYIRDFEQQNFYTILTWRKHKKENPLYCDDIIDESEESSLDNQHDERLHRQLLIFEYLVIQMERAFDKYILTSYNYLYDSSNTTSVYPPPPSAPSSTPKDKIYSSNKHLHFLREGNKNMTEKTYLEVNSLSTIPNYLRNKQSKMIASDACTVDLKLLLQCYCVRPRLRQIDDYLKFVCGAYSAKSPVRKFHYYTVICSLVEVGNIEYVKKYVQAQFDNCEMSNEGRINTMYSILKIIRSKISPSLRRKYCTDWKKKTLDEVHHMKDLLTIAEWNQVIQRFHSKIDTTPPSATITNTEQLLEWVSTNILLYVK
ncbi:hypothetical protein FDP41_007573 [Naegleria fowleri]|uniref:Uncharacterized protein n=1 Tax=Naegleria fowleri TaxID=5763 RepID=A0A6A5CDT8_NAEFO|nr:uncharacterized protein FDP41_007573 [Naegleria fowleri]KAF0983658.1 hypothetical protein FDP41_007573 [Naegleria fowleri]